MNDKQSSVEHNRASLLVFLVVFGMLGFALLLCVESYHVRHSLEARRDPVLVCLALLSLVFGACEVVAPSDGRQTSTAPFAAVASAVLSPPDPIGD